jgi:hypothetical protein
MNTRILTLISFYLLVNWGSSVFAETITHERVFPAQPTDWSDTVSIPKFDPDLGELLAVKVIVKGDVSGSIKFENTSSYDDCEVEAKLGANISLKRPDLTNLIALTARVEREFEVDEFDGRVDFGGRSGVTFSSVTASRTKYRGPYIADNAIFVGAGSIDLPLQVQGLSYISASEHSVYQFTSQAAVKVIVKYFYRTAPLCSASPQGMSYEQLTCDGTRTTIQLDGSGSMGGSGSVIIDDGHSSSSSSGGSSSSSSCGSSSSSSSGHSSSSSSHTSSSSSGGSSSSSSWGHGSSSSSHGGSSSSSSWGHGSSSSSYGGSSSSSSWGHGSSGWSSSSSSNGGSSSSRDDDEDDDDDDRYESSSSSRGWRHNRLRSSVGTGGLTYVWSTDCPNAVFSDDSAVAPTLTFDTFVGNIPTACTVTLTVVDQYLQQASCQTSVSVGTCFTDCRGIINGPAREDNCGVCEGDNTCYQCEDTDIISTKLYVDGRADAQMQNLKAAVRLRRAISGRKNYGKDILSAGKEFYNQSWQLGWSLPDIIRSCENTVLCQTVSNQAFETQYLSNADGLRSLTLQVLTGLNGRNSDEDISIKRIRRTANRLVREIATSLSSIPDSSECPQ